MEMDSPNDSETSRVSPQRLIEPDGAETDQSPDSAPLITPDTLPSSETSVPSESNSAPLRPKRPNKLLFGPPNHPENEADFIRWRKEQMEIDTLKWNFNMEDERPLSGGKWSYEALVPEGVQQ